MTAGSILERPEKTLGDAQGPRTAHRMLRETHNSWLVVLSRDRTPVGVLWEDHVAEAVRLGHDELPWSSAFEMPVVSHDRSEEHTSELQSRFDLVCRLLLEKK